MTNPSRPSSRLVRKAWAVFFVILGCLILLLGPAHFIQSRIELRMTAQAKSDLRAIHQELEAFKAMTGRFPTTEEGLEALVSRPASMKDSTQWRPLVVSLPEDPWGSPYHYICPANSLDPEYDLSSLGPDKIPSADDIAYSPDEG